MVGLFLVLPACPIAADGEPRAKGRVAETTSETTAATQPRHPICGGRPDDLVDPDLPRAQAGDRGYGYHQVAEDDFDGDGVQETAHVIAQLTKGPDGEYMGDHAPNYHVYVDEPSGERTYLFSGSVWGGKLEVDLSRGDWRVFVIQYEGASAFEVYCAAYLGPGKVTTTNVAGFGRSRGSFRPVE
jgi:hypothetical protein